jgi:hypothetical protein
MRHLTLSGATGAQVSLLSYWLTRQDSSGRVPLETINAGDLRSILSGLSIVELDAEGRCRFRLAGSRLCEEFGQELRGKVINDALGERSDEFSEGVAEALESGQPVAGVRDSARQGECHAWLRLPVSGSDPDVNQVLCLDEFVPQRALLPKGEFL